MLPFVTYLFILRISGNERIVDKLHVSTLDELVHSLKDSGAKYIYTIKDFLPNARIARQEVNTIRVSTVE